MCLSSVRVIAGCAVDGASLVTGCAALHENAAAIAAFRVVVARGDRSTALGRVPLEVVESIGDYTLLRAVEDARTRLPVIVGDIDLIELLPVSRARIQS